jgi:peptide deformylase
MSVRPILVVGNPVLRQKAKRVSRVDQSIHKLIDDMVETMRAAPGVGLAAPQVGVPLRVAVIEVDEKVTVIVNPEIVKVSGEYEPDEGCLSVPGYWGRLRRAEKVTVKAKDRHGKDFRITAEGLLAQALQHEIDHLDGCLYIDRMEELGMLDELRRAEPLRKREAEARREAAVPEG